MGMSDSHCHSCTCRVTAPPEDAFAYLSDGIRQGEWTFGSLDRRKVGENLFVGTSMFDQEETFIKIDADAERLLVHYHIGPDPEHLQARNMARIVPGQELGLESGTCLVTLLAWRSAFMDDDRWKQLCVSHETQMFIIKKRLESEVAR